MRYVVFIAIFIVAFMLFSATAMALEPADDQYVPPTALDPGVSAPTTDTTGAASDITRQALPSTGMESLIFIGTALTSIAAGATLLKRGK